MPFQSNSKANPSYTAFLGLRKAASGPMHEVAVVLHSALRRERNAALLVFSDDTGEQVEVDLRGSKADVAARYTPQEVAEPGIGNETGTRGRGRPRLGVVSREVTLLPEHWDWLASQPGGASVALRKLVHEARRAGVERDQRRNAQERAYRVMSALAGNLPGFEEASRALFAGKPKRLASEGASWPADVLEYVLRLAHTGSDSPAHNEP